LALLGHGSVLTAHSPRGKSEVVANQEIRTIGTASFWSQQKLEDIFEPLKADPDCGK
jgi:hypothetical protein